MDEQSKKLAESLKEILVSISAERGRRPQGRPVSRSGGLYRMSEFPDEEDLYLMMPVVTALHAGVKDFGAVIGRSRTLEQMREILDAAIHSMPETEEWKDPTPSIDAAWDGVRTVDGGIWRR